MKAFHDVSLVFGLFFLFWVGHGNANYTTKIYQHSKHPKHKFNGASHNYREALSKAILFYEGQCSGKLPGNQRMGLMGWRRDSTLSYGFSQHVDLVGGYYDAGDNIKFGFPMEFTTTMLSWSVLEFGGFMGSELANSKAAIRWATDYLLKATTHLGTIYVQVGDPNTDHKCWERPEDMDTVRTVYKIDSQHHGSDVVVETAAALAAASLVFRKSDPSYSKQLIHTSMRFQIMTKITSKCQVCARNSNRGALKRTQEETLDVNPNMRKLLERLKEGRYILS